MSRFGIKGIPFRYKGAKNVEDCVTSEEVIQKSGLDWEVAKCPLVAKMDTDTIDYDANIDAQYGDSDAFIKGSDLYRTCPNAFATYRTDKGIPLGIVKDRYTEVQNIDAFNFFNGAIGKDKAIWQTAGFFGNGERIFVSAKLPNNILVNGKDNVDNYLVFTTSHDGTSGIKILFTPIRVVCENTLNAAIRGASNYVSFRHTKSVHDNIDAAADILGISKAISDNLQNEFDYMSKVKMTDNQVQSFFGDVILTQDEKDRIQLTGHTMAEIILKNWRAINDTEISMKKVNTLSAMNDYYFDGPGQREILGTGWGAYNAVTGYYSNIDNAEGLKRMDSLLYGSKANKIQTAGELILKYAI